MKDNAKVKCSKVRKCKWKGEYKDMVDKPVPSKHFFNMTEKRCPKCGNNEFYEID